MSVRKIEIEWLSITSSKPFEAVVAALEAAFGHPEKTQFTKVTEGARTFAELESTVDRSLGRTGLMPFMKLDAGAVLRKETGLDTPKILLFVIGNPLIKEMAKHVPDAAAYAPVTILADERPEGVHLAYDKMASFLAPYGNPERATWIQRSRTFFASRLIMHASTPNRRVYFCANPGPRSAANSACIQTESKLPGGSGPCRGEVISPRG